MSDNDLIIKLNDDQLEWLIIYKLRKKTIEDLERTFKLKREILISKYSGSEDNRYYNEIISNLSKLLSTNQSQLDRMMIKEVNQALQSYPSVEDEKK